MQNQQHRPGFGEQGYDQWGRDEQYGHTYDPWNQQSAWSTSAPNNNMAEHVLNPDEVDPYRRRAETSWSEPFQAGTLNMDITNGLRQETPTATDSYSEGGMRYQQEGIPHVSGAYEQLFIGSEPQPQYPPISRGWPEGPYHTSSSPLIHTQPVDYSGETSSSQLEEAPQPLWAGRMDPQLHTQRQANEESSSASQYSTMDDIVSRADQVYVSHEWQADEDAYMSGGSDEDESEDEDYYGSGEDEAEYESGEDDSPETPHNEDAARFSTQQSGRMAMERPIPMQHMTGAFDRVASQPQLPQAQVRRLPATSQGRGTRADSRELRLPSNTAVNPTGDIFATPHQTLRVVPPGQSHGTRSSHTNSMSAHPGSSDTPPANNQFAFGLMPRAEQVVKVDNRGFPPRGPALPQDPTMSTTYFSRAPHTPPGFPAPKTHYQTHSTVEIGNKRRASSLSCKSVSTTGSRRKDRHIHKKPRTNVVHINHSRPGGSADHGTPPGSTYAMPEGGSDGQATPPGNPYAIPASRGEVAALRQDMEGLANGFRAFQTTIVDLLKTRLETPQEGSVPTPHSSSHNQHRVHTSRDIHKARSFVPKRKTGPVHRPDGALLLSRDVQMFARRLMNRQSYDDSFDASTIASPDEVSVFEKSRDGPHCCTVENFRIDINSGALNRWNRSASMVFARAFVESEEFLCEDQDEIAQAFLTHVRTLRKKFRERGLTAQSLRDKQKKANRDQRKQTLFQRRRRACLKYAQLTPHLDMLERFGVDGMSSDESEDENGVKHYVILKKSWRPQEVEDWLQGMDAVAALTTNRRGNQPRVRMLSTRVDDCRPAVQGLPRNAYSAVWYATLGAFTRADLHRSEELYDFSHCEEVRIAVEAYIDQLNRPAVYR